MMPVFIGRRIAVQNQVLDARRLLLEWRLQIELVGVGSELDVALEKRGTGAGAEAAVEERAGPIDYHPGGIEIVFGAETVAGRARAVRRIEAEGTRLELRNGNATIGAGEFFGEDMILAADDGDRHQAGSELEGGSDGLLEARGDALLDQQTVDYHFDGVVLALVQNGRRVERVKFAIHADADVAILRKLLHFLAIKAFAATHDGSENHDAIIGLAKVAIEDGLDDLVAGLASDGLTAIGTMGNADGAVNDAEIIVNFGDGADGGTRGARSGFLLDGN